MSVTRDDREPTLGVALERFASRVTDTQAAILCAVGALVTAALALFVPGGWRFALATGAAAAFGCWIIAARSHLPAPLGRTLQRVALVSGVVAAFAFGLSLLTAILGTWIS